jgi:hypothetical protein
MQMRERTYIRHEFNAGSTTHLHSDCDHFIAQELTYHSLLLSPLSAAVSHSPPWIIRPLVPTHAEWISACVSRTKHGHLAQYGCDGTHKEAGGVGAS